MPMASTSRAYRDLTRHLVRHRRRDLLVPLQEARKAVVSLGAVIDIAERRAPGRTVVWLKTEALRRRAEFEHVVFHVIEAISDESDGSDVVSAIMGGDGDRLLADVLLDGD
jgi:hypothetical protein